MGFYQRVKPQLGKECVRPTLMVRTPPTPAPAASLAQDATQSHPYPAIDRCKRGLETVLEVTKPASQCTVDMDDDDLQSRTVGPLGFLPQSVLELVQTLLLRPVVDTTLGPFEVIAQKLKAFLANVHQPRLGRVQRQADLRRPLLHQRQGPLRFLRRSTQDHEVVRVTHHRQALFGQQVVERVQVDVCKKRTADRSLRFALIWSPLLQPVQDTLS